MPRLSWIWEWLLERWLTAPERVNPIELIARAFIWVVILVLSWGYVLSPIQRSQVSPNMVHFNIARVNLVFHEAGHILFGVFGDFIATLGGSLMQVLIPLVCAVTFLRHWNAFGASVTTWWAGQSLIELAPYINDARDQEMILLGGVTGRNPPGHHDWNNLLSRLGLLQYDHGFAKLAHGLGTLLIVVALVWGAYLLYRQYENSEGFG